MIHLDEITGLLARGIHRFAKPVESSLDRIEIYAELSLDQLFVEPPKALPELKRRRRWKLAGQISEDWSFTSPHQALDPLFDARSRSEYPENRTVWTRRVLPSGRPARGRLLYIHGWLQPETLFEEIGLVGGLGRALGLEVLHMQVPYHGRRTPRAARFSGELLWTADLVRSFESIRQTVLDARTLLAHLRAQDSRPIGVAGVSLGGFFSHLLACLDHRLAFAIPVIAHMDLSALVRDAPVMSSMRRQLDGFGWSMHDLAVFIEQLGWSQLQPRIDPKRIEAHMASADRFFDPSVARDQFERWGISHHWYQASHMSFIPRLPLALRRMRRLVDAAL